MAKTWNLRNLIYGERLYGINKEGKGKQKLHFHSAIMKQKSNPEIFSPRT